ncbi:MAG TPA: hypothetical protein PLQ76_07645, partial [bacterium]|nr:hypothetical protein [bacterium]
MARKILTIVIFLFLLQKCAAARDEGAHLTIELNSGAVVVYADEDVIRGIKKDLGKEALPRMEPETLSNILKEKYPGKVETLVFHSAGKKVETDRNG